MANDAKMVELLCPKCNHLEMTALDEEDPLETVLVELACAACLESDGSLPIEPIYRDAHGVQLTSAPRYT